MCRGDVPFELCGQCVINATQKLSLDLQCSLSKQVVIWYDECMVRYSNRSFFSTVDTRPTIGLSNTANISNQANFTRLMFETVNETADKAAIATKKYATKQANIFEFRTFIVWFSACRTCQPKVAEVVLMMP